MAIFRRRKNQTISELEDYYANRNNRTGMAWLMAFISLLITVAVSAAIFFGGRWVYRSLTADDNTEVIVATNEKSEQSEPANNSQNDVNGSSVEPDGVVTDEAANTSVPSSERSSSESQKPIPDTGAGTTAMIVVAGAGVTGFMISRRRQLKNNQ